MLLSDAKKNQKLKVIAVNSDDLRIQLMKMGLREGDIISVSQKISSGTALVSHKFQEIALGSKHLQLIEVDLVYA